MEDYSPTITLAVAPDSVTEDGTANLVYTFFRNGVTTSALAVQYSIAGTADATDYTGATPGTGKTVSFVAGSATAVVIVNPMADTSVEANETVTLTLAVGTGYTVGTAPAVIGSIRNDDVRSAISTTLVGDQSSLLLTDTSRISGVGNSRNNTIAGNASNNGISGSLGKDLLTGGGPSDSDTFSYAALNESLLSGFDTITDYTGRDRLIVPLSVETTTLDSSAGNVQSLTISAIAGLLTTSSFAANTAKAFTATGHAGTFVALNDNRAGFQEASDAIIFLRGFTFSATNFIELL